MKEQEDIISTNLLDLIKVVAQWYSSHVYSTNSVGYFLSFRQRTLIAINS